MLPSGDYPLKSRGGNVVRLLAWREVTPVTRRPLRRLWHKAAAWSSCCTQSQLEATDAKRALISWLEAESLRHCTAKYCTLEPAPRSTIAAAFSPDGNTLASTHGDHTVKIICCQTGLCLKVLSGHRRTPWVVRFHPSSSEVLASGSLDNEVRLWDATTAECVGSRDFYRPIASLAFHSQGDLLAVASGHKLYIWQFTKEGEGAVPIVVLRTRRSLRAVHFPPHAAPFLLTAEVNDLDSPDCPMTMATSHVHMHYPPPAIYFAPPTPSISPSVPSVPFPQPWFWPGQSAFGSNLGLIQSDDEITASFLMLDPDQDFGRDSVSTILATDLGFETSSPWLPQDSHDIQFPDLTSPKPVDILARPLPGESSRESAITSNSRLPLDRGEMIDYSETKHLESYNSLDMQLGGNHGQSSSIVRIPWDVEGPAAAVGTHWMNGTSSHNSPAHRGPAVPVAHHQHGMVIGDARLASRSWPATSVSSSQEILPAGDCTGWELPFLHGWVQGRQLAHAGLGLGEATINRMGPPQQLEGQNEAVSIASSRVMASASIRAENESQIDAGAGMRVYPNQAIPISRRGGTAGIGAAETAVAQSAMAAAVASAELPCTVKLRIWPHDIKHPSALLDPEMCRLVIPHAVLCSEMGAHFSPCGRFLAACVACVLPAFDAEYSILPATVMGSPNFGTRAHSPTQHPISTQQVIYELRVYSLEEATFGQVLASRAVRAAHCLTSIQFSPTSGHLLLAYGRRHNSLLKSLIVDGTTTIPVYTVLEVYRVVDMELVRVLPSVEDEVNVACFHPQVGGGLVYGTKEGKLRILVHDRSSRLLNPHQGLEDELVETETLDAQSFGDI
ncbi:hypothetical protein CY35_U000100 [Sphagnum magellanicum]|uniref:Uncharacterized protein n=1 Tax=Sphagnum magellanicum TaxID=128215 RepID=A0AAD4QG58_9BRYO|nr:hypothetical protein CY35_U000100 [Sphagnum magellanicum]